jgi:uncharacterized membrane protein
MFLLGIAAIAGFVLALKTLFHSRRLQARLNGLAAQVSGLDNRLVGLAGEVGLLRGVAPPKAVAPARAAPSAMEPTATEPESPAEEPAAPLAPVAAMPQPATAPGGGWEQVLVQHWLVWVGGAAIALGGAFLVKLSIDQGLLTPLVRVVLGLLLGIGLSVGAEWVRRHDNPPEPDTADATQGTISYIPQALAAAGAATIFASLYAAYALYGFLPAPLAFLLLAATAAATVAQSLRLGPLVAALGLIGAFVVPMLVASESPHAGPLFAYLALVTAGSLAVLRHRAWWWLAWPSLAGAMVWVWLWLALATEIEAPVVALYLLVQFGLFVAFRRGIARIGFLAGIADTLMVRVVTRAALWAIAFGFLLLASADDFGTTSVGAATLLIVGLMALAYRDSALDDVIAAAGVLAPALLASWTLQLPLPEMSLWVFRLQTDHVTNFTAAAIVLAALLGGGGFLVLPQVARPGRWAALSATVPLLVLVIAYWRLQQFELYIAWSLAALALAGVELLAAASVAQRRGSVAEPAIQIEIALAAYAIGVLGGTICAATLALGEAWLTVALALHLPALGWIEGRLRLPVLRWPALAIADIVLVRLVLNPYVLDYPIGSTPIFNWLLYGYGVPAASFIVATRQFGSSRDDHLVAVLEAGSALFTLLLLSLELTHAVYGDLATLPLEDFGAGAALIALWLTFGGVLLLVGGHRQRAVLRWGGLLLVGGTTIAALVWQPLMLVDRVSVGDLWVLDALLLADAAPALVYAMIAWGAAWQPLRIAARILAAIYAFAWLTLEIQHVFHGTVELFAGSTEAEWYVYSVAWLAFAGAGLAAGLLSGNRWLRQAGLIGIGLVIAKVFLSDMAELSGVLRALSFLGLGGALIGLGYAYRRFRPVQA